MTLIQNDNRGYIQSFHSDNREYLIIFTRKGYMRGGDKHNTAQFNVILEGTVDWTYCKNYTEYEDSYYAGDTIITQPNMPHMMLSFTDSLMIEYKEKDDPNKEYYERYREIIGINNINKDNELKNKI